MTSLTPKKMHGVNAIPIGDESYLLAGGEASHLVAEARDDETARPAVETWHWNTAEEWQSAYSRAELEEPRWKERTLCGRDWINMEPADGPGLSAWSSPVYAPSCRTCLRIVSSRLESHPPDDRIPLVATLVLQEVLEHGQSRVDGVPGDQAEALRGAIRRELRGHNLRGRTYLQNETVYAESDGAYEALPDQRKDEIQQQVLNALDSLFKATDGRPPHPQVVSWDTWRVP